MSNSVLAQSSQQSLPQESVPQFFKPLSRVSAVGQSPVIFTDIYQPQNNIVIWQRSLPTALQQALCVYLQANPKLNITKVVTPESGLQELDYVLDDLEFGKEIREQMAELVDMFACLFDLKRVGLRLAVLEHAMCPRFHVDKVPCRLVTTFCGAATQWLPHHLANRDKLATGDSDETSGLYADSSCVHSLAVGDVALLKGELWQDNEGGGLIHRSPPASSSERRLVLTLDFVI